MKKRIFIGASSEAKGIAKALAKELARTQEFEPLPWWEMREIGEFTLDTLIHAARSVDAAIMVFAADDRVQSRKKQFGAPRDNVVLEYGLFAGQLGRRRTFLMADPDVKLPADINGLQFAPLKRRDAAAKTVAALRQKLQETPPPSLRAVSVVADPALVDDFHNPPAKWHQRALYLGIEGARYWLGVMENHGLVPAKYDVQLREIYRSMAAQTKVQTFVSMGPGNADIDHDVTSSLKVRDPSIRYVPVDISDGLLRRAVRRIAPIARVPIGVLADFEDGMAFVGAQLEEYAPPPRLLALLGNTIGNLDGLEEQFINSAHGLLGRDDYLLLDASLALDGWSREKDPRGLHAGYSPEVRAFIANGVARVTSESVQSIAQNFESRIDLQSLDKHTSDVHGTKGVQVIDAKRGPVLSVRRYNEKNLTKWLEKSFRIVDKKKPRRSAKVTNDCVYLLRKK